MPAALLLDLVALVGGTVHTMLPGDEPRVATVLVRDGRIEAVGELAELPEGTRAIDARGQHLVPGLVDAMVHHDWEHDALYVLAGVTLVRDMGNDLGRILAARAPAVRDALPGPALLVCGGVLDGVPPASAAAVVVTSAEEVDDKLPRLLELGVDFASFHLGIPEPAWKRVLELARERGFAAWGPVPSGRSLDEALALGQRGIVGLDAFAPRGRGLAELSADELRARAEATAAAGAAVVPLLHAFAQGQGDPSAGAEALAWLAPSYEAHWMADLRARAAPPEAERARAAAAELRARQRLALELWKAGAGLLPGSGAPNPWVMPGAGLHEELLLLAAAGIPAQEVLRLATRGAAELLGVEGERGAIAPGLAADIVCTAGDPRLELTTLRAPRRVLVRGRVLEREDLDRLRDALRARQDLARESLAHALEVEPPVLPAGKLVLAGCAEASAAGQRFARERYALVQLEDGTSVYLSRSLSLAEGGAKPTETVLEQRIRDGRVASFELRVASAGNELVVKGLGVGGQLRIERRWNGAHLDTSSVVERVAAVDAGSAITAIVLARHQLPGAFRALWFESADPAVGQFELATGEDGLQLVRGPGGPWAATFDAAGRVDLMERQRGAGSIVWEGVELEAAATGGSR